MLVCLNPVTVKAKEGLFGNETMEVPCGRCLVCQKNYARQWVFRLKAEKVQSINSAFLTLTYDEENVPWKGDDMSLDKGDLKQFHKSLKTKVDRYYKRINKPEEKEKIISANRKMIDLYGYDVLETIFEKRKIRYYAIGEYGDLGRPHYHGIYFNIPLEIQLNLPWEKGNIHKGEVTDKSIHYVTGYMLGKEQKDKEKLSRRFAMMSRDPGIGYNYIVHGAKYHQDNMTIKSKDGMLPRYLKEKIFTDEKKKNELQRRINNEMQENFDLHRKKLDKKGIDINTWRIEKYKQLEQKVIKKKNQRKL